MKPCPPPGIYENVPFEVYASWDAINNSGISRFLRSPAHYLASLNGPDDETAAKERGTICHAGILEPGRFAQEYAVGPDVKLNTKAGKTEWEMFCADNPGKVHVRGADGAAMLGCHRAIWSHPAASALLGSKGPCEVSIVWDDKATGLRCKARIDKLARDFYTVVDLKTTRDARPEEFRKSVYSYGYHRQAAFNLHGLAAVGECTFDVFSIIAIEPEPPYCLRVYELDHDAIEAGHIEIVAALVDFKECKESGRWPGYPEQAERIALPPWTGETRRRAVAI